MKCRWECKWSFTNSLSVPKTYDSIPMARIRTIKPEFWTDDKIISLPYSVRLFFIGLWNFSDDYGALQDKPDQLKLLILPSDESFDVYQMIDLLIAADLVERYVDYDKDNTFLLIKNWDLHQKVDKPTKSRILKDGAKKVCIPALVRRKIAEKYGCIPGKTKQSECYFCGSKGSIYWPTKKNNEPSNWVCFSHEFSHLIPESKDGSTDELNLVLACRNCNRSMGVRNAFDWLFNGVYHTNQYSETILNFRERSREFESVRDGREGNGKDSIGKEGSGIQPEQENGEQIFDPKNKKEKKYSSPGAEIFTIEHCLVVAMNDDRWVYKNKATKELLQEFNSELEGQGIYEKNPLDYKQHFYHWKKNKKNGTHQKSSSANFSNGKTGEKQGTSDSRISAAAKF